MKRVWTFTFLHLLFVLGATHLFAQVSTPDALVEPQGTRRLALVIGNDSYPGVSLKNARNDARAIASALRELDFVVTSLENAPRSEIVATINAFGKELRPDDVVFFYFAGHGLQVGGENYLVPIDFERISATAVGLGPRPPRPGQARRRAAELSRRAVPASALQGLFSKAKVSIMVFDACRENPIATARGVTGGLAPMEARGNLIVFATGAGQIASDASSGSNGLFTHELLESLREPGISLRDMFFRVRRRVFAASNGQQFPAVYDGLIWDLILRPSEPNVPSTGPSSAR